MAYTYTELLDDLKVRGMIPTGQATFTQARFLSAVNAVMRSKILPFVLRLRENFYAYDIDFAINATGTYRIPSRAIAAKLKDVAIMDGSRRIYVAWLKEHELNDLQVSPYARPGVFLKRNSMTLVPPTPNAGSLLRVSIFLRPGEIVDPSNAAQITSIDPDGVTVGFASVPISWSNSNLFELVQAEPHFDCLGYDLPAATVNTGVGGHIVFSDPVSTDLVVGDWVSLTGQTPVIQVPLEMHPYLAQVAANYCMRGQSDSEAYKMGLDEEERLQKDLTSMFQPRIEDEGKKLVNRTGIVRRGM